MPLLQQLIYKGARQKLIGKWPPFRTTAHSLGPPKSRFVGSSLVPTLPAHRPFHPPNGRASRLPCSPIDRSEIWPDRRLHLFGGVNGTSPLAPRNEVDDLSLHRQLRQDVEAGQVSIGVEMVRLYESPVLTVSGVYQKMDGRYWKRDRWSAETLDGLEFQTSKISAIHSHFDKSNNGALTSYLTTHSTAVTPKVNTPSSSHCPTIIPPTQ